MLVQPAAFNQLPVRASTTNPAPANPPSAPADAIDLSGLTGLPKVLQKTGEGLAKIGGWGGAALGAGLGVVAQGGLSGGWLMPALSAFIIGTDAAKARRGQETLEQGSGAVVNAFRNRQEFTPARGAASALTVCACVAEMAAGYAIAGLPGMFVAMPAMLGTAFVMGRAAGQVEEAVLSQALQKQLQP